MNARTQARQMAKRLGCSISINADSVHSLDVGVEAPPGKRFALGPHEVIGSVEFPREDGNAESVWRGLMRDMEQGIEDCTDPECEWCHPEAE